MDCSAAIIKTISALQQKIEAVEQENAKLKAKLELVLDGHGLMNQLREKEEKIRELEGVIAKFEVEKKQSSQNNIHKAELEKEKNSKRKGFGVNPVKKGRLSFSTTCNESQLKTSQCQLVKHSLTKPLNNSALSTLLEEQTHLNEVCTKFRQLQSRKRSVSSSLSKLHRKMKAVSTEIQKKRRCVNLLKNLPNY